MLTEFTCNIVVLNSVLFNSHFVVLKSEIHMIYSSWISVFACEYVCVGNERKKERRREKTSG